MRQGALLFLLIFLASLLSACGGQSPGANTPITKYNISGAAPNGTITPSNTTFYNQVSVSPFASGSAVTLITLTKTANSRYPTFSESVTTSANSQYAALSQPANLLSGQSQQIADYLTAEALVRDREQQLYSSVTPSSARNALQRQTLMAPSAVATASVGAWTYFNVYDFNTGGNHVVQATCQYDGKSAYIFVDNTIGTAGSIYDPASPSNVLNAISTAFDAIYSADRAAFGSEWYPGIDGDPKIYILISPAVNSKGTNNILGYFYSGDEYPKFSLVTSNQHEMFYVIDREKGTTADLWADAGVNGPDSKRGYAILAHEFQHMINFNQKTGHNGLYDGPPEDTWLNEGLSMYAMQICGFGLPQGDSITAKHVLNYLNNPQNFSLTNWNYFNPGYGSSYLFMLYLVEHYGGGAGSAASQQMLQKLESNGLTGIANVEAVTGTPFGTTFKNWAMANLLDKITTDNAYNYTSIDLHGAYGGVTLHGVGAFSPQGPDVSQPGWTVIYQQFTGGTGNALNISIQSRNAGNNLEGVVVVQ